MKPITISHYCYLISREKNDIKESLIELVLDKDYVVIKGLYEDIITNKAQIDNHKLDYVKVLLEDTVDIPDGISKIKSLYNYLMEFAYVKDSDMLDNNTGMNDLLASKMLSKTDELSTVVEIFEDFTKNSSNYDLTEDDKTLVKDIINGMLRGGEHED